MINGHSKQFVKTKTLQSNLKAQLNRSSHPEVSCKKVVFKNFAKFTGKHLSQSLFLLNKRPLHRCFLENFAIFLRTSIFIEYLRWLLLKYSTVDF